MGPCDHQVFEGLICPRFTSLSRTVHSFHDRAKYLHQEKSSSAGKSSFSLSIFISILYLLKSVIH